jgi:hypothetical protein
MPLSAASLLYLARKQALIQDGFTDLGSGGEILRGSSPLSGNLLRTKELRKLNNDSSRGVAVLLQFYFALKMHENDRFWS